MAAVYDDLPDHEGYGLRRLPDGTLTGTWTADTERFTAWVAACSCGWRDDHAHKPDEDGREAALNRWDHVHAVPLLERAVPRHIEEFVEQARLAVAELAGTRPLAAVVALDRIEGWSRALRANVARGGEDLLTVQQRLDAFANRARRGSPTLGR